MRTVIATAPRNVALTATTLLAGRDFLQYIHGKGTKEQHVVILYGTLYLLAISKDHQSHFQKLYRSSRQPKKQKPPLACATSDVDDGVVEPSRKMVFLLKEYQNIIIFCQLVTRARNSLHCLLHSLRPLLITTRSRQFIDGCYISTSGDSASCLLLVEEDARGWERERNIDCK